MISEFKVTYNLLDGTSIEKIKKSTDPKFEWLASRSAEQLKDMFQEAGVGKGIWKDAARTEFIPALSNKIG